MLCPSPFRPRLTALALHAAAMALPALAVSTMAMSAQAQATEATHRFDIPAGPLSGALARAAAQAGGRLTVDAALTSGRSVPPLQGTMTLRQALEQLLAGSGLEATTLPDGGYTLRKRTAPPPAQAADARPPEQDLPSITVLGTREPNVPMSSVPSSISRVGQPTVLRDLATSAPIEDILARNVPGVHPSNVGSRTIRGRTAQVFINGTPMNEQMRFGSGSDLNALSPDHLESIEVSRGANSAYGFGSPGGIIALGTPRARSAELTLATRLRTSVNTAHPGGSVQATAYQSAAQIVDQFDYHVAFSATRDGTSRTPGGEVANIFSSPGLFKTGDEDIYNVDANLGYDLGTAGQLRLVLTGQYIDYAKYYGFEGGVYRVSHVTTTPVAQSGRSWRRAATFNLSYEIEDVLGSSLRVEAFGSRVRASRHELGDEWFKDENAYTGIRSALTTPLDGLQRGAAVTYGLDAIRNDMDDPLYNSSSGELTGRFGPPAQLDMWAPYVQLKWPVGNSVLSGGLRYERYGGRVDSTGNGTVTTDDGPGGRMRDFGIALFNLGVLHPLDERTDLHATYTQGAEISQIRRAGFVVASPDRIDPQAVRSHQYEIGLRRKGNGLAGGVTAFYTRSRLMSSTDCSDPDMPCTPLREPRNIWGLELSGEWTMAPAWKATGTLTWHDGRRKAEGSNEWTRVSSIDVAPAHGSMTLGYAPAGAGQRHELIVDWRAGRGRIGDGWPEGQVDALTLLHLSSSIEVGPGNLEFGVHNLLDKTYYSIQAEAYNGGWVWLPEQGRRVSLGYRVTW